MRKKHQWSPAVKTFLFLAVVSLLPLLLNTKQLKLTNNPLCYRTDQTKSLADLIKECSFHFFEQRLNYGFILPLKGSGSIL